ncbi:MAG: acyl carrier protein, partial [Bacteroidota bacterium]
CGANGRSGLRTAGYVARNTQVAQHLDSVGIKGFSAKLALSAMGRAMASHKAHVGIMKMDWRTQAGVASSQRSPKFSHLMSADLLRDGSGNDRGRIRDTVLAASPEQRLEIVQSFLKEQIARVLGTSAAKLDAERPLNEMGLDSLMMVELKNRIEKEIGTSLPTVELMRGPSISKLSTVLLSQVTGTLSTHQQPSPPNIPKSPQPDSQLGRPDELLKKLDTLSEGEVDSLLTSLVSEDELKALVAEKNRR